MSPEQMSLYDNPKGFEVAGKNPKDVENKDKEEILRKKIDEFIESEEVSRIINRIIIKEGELGMHAIEFELVKKFSGAVDDDERNKIRSFFARALFEKKFKLSGAVVRAEINGFDSGLMEKTKKRATTIVKPSPKPEINEIKKARAKLPPHQRGIPNGDL